LITFFIYRKNGSGDSSDIDLHRSEVELTLEQQRLLNQEAAKKRVFKHIQSTLIKHRSFEDLKSKENVVETCAICIADF
jgi:hypothetical protein